MRRRGLPRYGRTPTGLNDHRVHVARTAGLTDACLARAWGVPRLQVRKARTGLTFADHPTPPDVRPRDATGRKPVTAASIRERPRASHFQFNGEAPRG